MKKAYQTDLAGILIGDTVADESPLEPGQYLLPAGATFTPPPLEWPEDKWPRWNGSKWELVTKPTMPAQPTPEQKLADFLAQNPDVLSLVNNGGANV